MKICRKPLREEADGAGSGAGDGAGAGAPPVLSFDQKLMPEDIRGEASLATFKTIPELAKSYVNAQKLIGTKRLPTPEATWDDKQWDAFYSQAGRPETPDKYDFKGIKTIGDLPIDQDKVKPTSEFFHKLGLNPRQARGLLEYYGNLVGTATASEKAKHAEAITTGTTALQNEWGDKFEPNLNIAKSVIKKFGPEIVPFLEESGLGNHPAMVKMLHSIGTAMLEDTHRGGGAGGDLNLTDTTKAGNEIERLKLDGDFQKALQDARHPAHSAAVDRWTNLFKVAHPGQERE